MQPEIFAYYFPNYHLDARNEQQHGKGWDEWKLVREAKPRFAGHVQPKVPLWGYEDEADPQAMAKKIDAAADHGVSGFIFDWYYYNDGPFLERALDEGFLHAPNNERLKFALMWANHGWTDIHPARTDVNPELLYSGEVSRETFERVVKVCIEKYFHHPSYWKIDGCPYFSVYELATLIKGLGGIEETKEALEYFRAQTKAAGFPDLHLDAIVMGIEILPNEQRFQNPNELLKTLGFSSVASYVWVHHVRLDQFPASDYRNATQQSAVHWQQARADYVLPYIPNVTMGWDASPRCHQDDAFDNSGYPFMATLENNTPQNFEAALREVKAFLEEQSEPRAFTINAWNEWTEGSYLEPDTVHGMSYLEAIRNVFGSPPNQP